MLRAAAKASPPTKRRYIEETLADFRELEPTYRLNKERAGEIKANSLSSPRNIWRTASMGINAWEKIVTDENVSGLPKFTEAARQSAKQRT